MPVLLRWRPAEPSTLQTPVALPRSRKGLNFREQDTGQGFRFMEGNSRALVKVCVKRPARCPLPPKAGCPGGAPFIAIHAGVVSEILCIQLSVGGLSLLTYQADFLRFRMYLNEKNQNIFSTPVGPC